MHSRQPYQEVLASTALLERLRPFDPAVIGTPPLRIDVATSDLDIACSHGDIDYFDRVITADFGGHRNFEQRRSVVRGTLSTVTRFARSGWQIELFCQPIPTIEQWGVRHFLIERQILALRPDMRSPLRALKRAGYKTEPAFAHLLELHGDPYHAVLALENESTAAIRRRVAQLPIRNRQDP